MKKINNDDLTVGMFITAGETSYERHDGGGMFGPLVTVTQVDRSYMGDVFEVLCIDRPYMVLAMRVSRVVGELGPNSSSGKPVSLEINERPWFECSPEFVNALAGREYIKPTQEAKK